MDLFSKENETSLDININNANCSLQHGEILTEPKNMTFCLGHDYQEALLLNLYKNNNMPHAIIFSGLKGIGKTTMAFRLARFLFKYGKINHNNNTNTTKNDSSNNKKNNLSSLYIASNDPIFLRIASEGYTDFKYIQRKFNKDNKKQDNTLKIDAIREIEPFLHKTALDGGWRIVIIEDADTMNRNAQNAILKILEEPPANVLIILIAHRPAMLIPTIRSRSHNIAFHPLSSTIIETLINNHTKTNLAPHEIKALVDLSEGSIGQAIKYIEHDGAGMLSKILDHINYMRKNKENYKIHTFSSSISSPAKDIQYQLFVQIIQWILHKIITLKARRENKLPVHLENEATTALMQKYTLKKLIKISDNLKDNFNRTDFSNLDRRDAIRTSFLMINQ